MKVGSPLLVHGPFTFIDNERSIFHDDSSKGPGVYVWAHAINGKQVISYVGMSANSIAGRQSDHIEEGVYGGKYRINYTWGKYLGRTPPEIWPGTYRLDPRDRPAFLELFKAVKTPLKPYLKLYIQSIKLFAIPCKQEKRFLERLEARLMTIVREQDSLSEYFLEGVRMKQRELSENPISITLNFDNVAGVKPFLPIQLEI